MADDPVFPAGSASDPNPLDDPARTSDPAPAPDAPGTPAGSPDAAETAQQPAQDQPSEKPYVPPAVSATPFSTAVTGSDGSKGEPDPLSPSQPAPAADHADTPTADLPEQPASDPAITPAPIDNPAGISVVRPDKGTDGEPLTPQASSEDRAPDEIPVPSVPQPVVTTTAPVQQPPVQVLRPRSDEDVLTGHFAQVIDGEHEGRYGVYHTTATVGDDGYPDTVIVRTRDDRDEDIIVEYRHLRPAQAGGR